MKIVILAGGTGKRLWPVSRQKDPKQFKPMIGKDTLLKATYKRLRKYFKAEDIYFSINTNQKTAVKKDLGLRSEKNFIIEPVKRGTAPAIGLVSLELARKNPDEIIATVNADHFIENHQEFARVLKLAEKAILKNPDKVLLIGIKPAYPETGYGYIKLDRQPDSFGSDKLFKVQSFVEKPDRQTAEKYLKSKKYLWNPAYFVFRAGTMLDLFKKHLPAHYKILNNIKNNPDTLTKEFSKMKKISIDYGIMEKTDRLICLPARFDWYDVGHWRAIHEILARDVNKNVVKGKYIQLDGSGNLIYSYSDKLIATVGIKDSIIIETGDVVLVCRKDNAQDVKKIVEELERKKMNKYL